MLRDFDDPAHRNEGGKEQDQARHICKIGRALQRSRWRARNRDREGWRVYFSDVYVGHIAPPQNGRSLGTRFRRQSRAPKRRTPCGLRGLTAQRGQARGSSCQEWKEAPAEPNQPEDSTREQRVGNLPLTTKAPCKVKNRSHRTMDQVMDAFGRSPEVLTPPSWSRVCGERVRMHIPRVA